MVFDFGRKLRGGAGVAGQIEMRVVAKAVFACAFRLPLPTPDAFGDDGLRVVGMAHENQHANVVAGFVGMGRKLGADFGVVGGIGFGVVACVSRGMHTWCAAQRVDADAAVVGKGGQAAVLAGVAGFGERVFNKGAKWLGAFGRVERGLWQDLDAVRGKQGGEFAQFACVVAGENDFGEHGFPCWAA